MGKPKVIAIDAALINIGVVAVAGTVIIDLETFRANPANLSGLAKYDFVAGVQSQAVRTWLDNYSRNITVIIETPTNRDGKTWTKWTAGLAFFGAGICYGAADALGFKVIELVPARAWGGGERRAELYKKSLTLARGLTWPTVKAKYEHVRDAAAMAAWYLAGRNRKG